MPRVILAAVLFLAACVANDARVAGFRNPETPIYSAAAFTPDRITGSWRQAAGFASSSEGCRDGAVEVTPAPGGLMIRGSLCLNGQRLPVDALARPSGPGRLAVAGQEDWWVLWVDSGYRSMVIGTPSGRFGFILDRGAIPSDRLTAASEVLDFNGYIVGALRPF